VQTITLAFPKADLQALLEDKQRELRFTTPEAGGVHIVLQVRENLPLGQRPKRFGGLG
jgi:hypothetical protein